MGNTSLTNLRPTKASLHSLIFSLSFTGTLILVEVLGGTTKISPLAAACSFTFFYKIFQFNSYSFIPNGDLLTICLIPFSWEAKVSVEFNSKLHTPHLEKLCFAVFGDISSSDIHLVLANLFLGSAALACFALGIVDSRGWRKLL